MTTGTYTVDGRFTETNDCGVSTGNCGFFYTKTWSGTDLPAGFDRTSVRTLPPHPYTCTISSNFNSPISYHWPGGPPVTNGRDINCFGDFVFLNAPSAAQKANLDIKALIKLRKSIEGGDFNAAIFLGTAHQSLATIAETATILYHAFKAVKHGNVKQAKRILTTRQVIWHPDIDYAIPQFARFSVPKERKANSLVKTRKTAANSWLQLQYGWLPLVSDLYSGAEELANQLYAPLAVRHHARSTITLRDNTTPSALVLDQAMYKYGISYTALHAETSSNIALLGLLNPETVLWELMPWSFVLDWALPIGNYLEARAFAQRTSGTFVKTIFTYEYTFGRRIVQSGWTTKVPSSGYRKRVTVTRTLPATLSVPLPRFKPFGEIPSWRRAANALALLTQCLH